MPVPSCLSGESVTIGLSRDRLDLLVDDSDGGDELLLVAFEQLAHGYYTLGICK